MRASPVLRGLAAREHKLLAAAAARRTFASGEQLAADGVPRLYLVLSGEVGAWAPADADGVEEVVGQEGPGAVVGGPIPAAEAPVYRAATQVDTLVWGAEDLRRVYSQADGLERRLAVRLSLRAREDELVALLRRTPLFQHVGQPLIRWALTSSTLDRFAAGGEICRKGDDGDAMFLVISGEVAIGETSADMVARLHRGDFFGEIALVSGSPRTSSATALSDAEILVVDKTTFEVLDERSSAFRHAVRLTAQRRIEVNAGGRREPELVWLVNGDPRCDTAKLAALLAEALGEEGPRAGGRAGAEPLRPAGSGGAEPLRSAGSGGGGGVEPLRSSRAGRVAQPLPLRSARALHAALQAARGAGAAHVLCWSDGPVAPRLHREVAERAASVVVVDGADVAPFQRGTFHRVHHVVVSSPGGAARPVRRDAIVLRADPLELRRDRLARLPDDARRGLRRIARAVARRRVGLALGGGAAWGYAHVALVRALEDARIPIDLVAGVSMGALVGAFYASQGLAGLDRLVDANAELAAAALGCVASTQAVSLFVRRHIPQSRFEELALPLATVAVDARTAREKVFRHGSISGAVRVSCSLPGVFAPSIVAGHRFVDGAVRHNVPAGVCIDAGADFVIACDVVPLPGVPRGKHRRGLRGLVLDVTQVNRLSDAVRSLYWLTSDSGQRQASVADAVFSPDLAEFEPWDFLRAKAMIARAEEQLGEWLTATVARYDVLAQAGRADG
jgi:predicted acylesterase/phospholipase RssA/CRP-like cAMP-binding protein